MKLGLGSGIGGSGNSLPRYVTDFANGFELPGDTFTGGPTTVADNDGTLVDSPAGVLPMTGMRLLGPELVTNGTFDSDTVWVKPPRCTIASGEASFSSVVNNSLLYQTLALTTANSGKRYQITFTVKAISTGAFAPRFGTGSTGTSRTGTGTYTEEGVIGASQNFGVQTVGTTSGAVDNISVREVFPTWLPTDASGDPIHTSTPLRTRKGTVSVYDESYMGPLIEPARTNLFLNSKVPITQNITTTAQQYTVTVKGTGSVTVSGTATGVATEGSPLTVTATAGTLTCTVAGTLSRVNVEAGAFGTSFITTGATTITRPADNLTRPTAGTALAALNNWAIRARFRPTAAGQTAVLWGSYTDANNATRLDLAPTTLTYTKRLAGVDHVAQASLTHAAATLYEALLYQHSVHGMGIAFRSWNGSAWSSWSTWVDLTDANGIANASIAATYQSGAVNNSSHVCANLPFVEVVTVPASVNPQSWLMDKISKNRI